MCSSFPYNTWKNDTCKCDTEGLLPVASLNGVVSFPSSFIRYLIDSTGKIWSYIYINVKLIYASETLACTISECAIVCNFLHVTSTFTLIYWCYRAANDKWTPRVFHSSLKEVEVNCVPSSAEILSQYYQPN